MTKTALLFLSCILFLSCNKDDDGDSIQTEFIVHPNSMLIINETEQSNEMEIVPGDHLVFEYRFTTEGRPEIADDELSKIVVFEVDKNTDDFSLSEENFEDAKTYLGRFCFCAYNGFYPVKSGNITGEKTGELSWKVSIDVKAPIETEDDFTETLEAQASGTFKPQN